VGNSGNNTRNINPQGFSGNTWLIGASFSKPGRCWTSGSWAARCNIVETSRHRPVFHPKRLGLQAIMIRL